MRDSFPRSNLQVLPHLRRDAVNVLFTAVLAPVPREHPPSSKQQYLRPLPVP